jgi:hypothetical protein
MAELLTLTKLIATLQLRYPDLVVERVLDEEATEAHNTRALKRGQPMKMVYETVISRPIPLAQRQYLAEDQSHDVHSVVAKLAWEGDAADVIVHCKQAFPDLVIKREGNRQVLTRTSLPGVRFELPEGDTIDLALAQRALVDDRTPPEHASWSQPSAKGEIDQDTVAAIAGAVAAGIAPHLPQQPTQQQQQPKR